MKAQDIRLANEAWEALFRAQATLKLEFERTGEWGSLLPTEYGVLYALSTAPDGLRLTELCEDALLTQAGISRLVSRLERRGLVARGTDPSDARAQRIHLTEKGVTEQRRVGLAHARHVATAMRRALTNDQLKMLRELGLKIITVSGTKGTRIE